MFLARKRIRLSKEEGRAETRAELQPRLDAAEATAAQAQATAAQYQATIVEATTAAAQATTAAAQATAAAAQANAQVEAMQGENRSLREGQALRDEEIRLLRERVSQLENGAGNAGNHG